MMHPLSPRSLRLLSSCVLTGALLATAAPAHAAINSCRADPIVWVGASTANQYKVQLNATVGVPSAAQVKMITYTLHIPVGQSLYSVTYTGGALGNKETVNVVADGAASTFNVTTLVTTLSHTYSVTSVEQVTHPGWNSGSPSTTASGTDGQDILTSVYLQ